MKKKTFYLTALFCASMLALTACGKTAAGETDSGETTAITDTAESTQLPDNATDSDASADATQSAETGDQLPEETIQFIVDITDNHLADEGFLIGNGGTKEGYLGILELHMEESLASQAADSILPGKTYLFTVTPMMTMSIPPQMIAIDFSEASEADITRLENIRQTTSNYQSCMERYPDMELEAIIGDANLNYATWTQEEIAEYLAFLTEKGYSETSSAKSYVNLRENLNGSIVTGAE